MKYGNPKYTQNEKRTKLYARFEYNWESNHNLLNKEDIQRRMDSMNNNELKDYLMKVEGLNLGSPRFANGDSKGSDKKGLGRVVGFSINKRKLTLSVDVRSKQQVPQKDMFNLDALDLFVGRGKYPGDEETSQQ